jgi:hypothetical protein
VKLSYNPAEPDSLGVAFSQLLFALNDCGFSLSHNSLAGENSFAKVSAYRFARGLGFLKLCHNHAEPCSLHLAFG